MAKKYPEINFIAVEKITDVMITALEKATAHFEEKGIYVDALENYESALELNPKNYEIVLKIADMYYKMGDINGFITTCDKAIGMKPKDPTPYVNKANYYISKAQYTEAIKVLKSATSVIKDNEQLNNLKVELSTKCVEKYVSFTTISDWHVQGETNYVAVEENGKWGMTLKDGTRKIRLMYEYLGAYDADSGVIPCCYEGNYYFIDLKGNKKLIGDNTYQNLGSFGCGLAPAQRDGKYGSIDSDFKARNFEFEYAGSFANDVAAVKKNGKWGFVDINGNIVIKPQYEDADSFGCDIGAVKVDGKWGYVSQDKDKKVIPYEYEAVNEYASQLDYAGSDYCRPVTDGHIAVKKNGMMGIINLDNDIIVPFEYTNIIISPFLYAMYNRNQY